MATGTGVAGESVAVAAGVAVAADQGVPFGAVGGVGARVAVGAGAEGAVGPVVGNESVGALVAGAKIGRTGDVGLGAAKTEQAATSNRPALNSARLRLMRTVPLVETLDRMTVHQPAWTQVWTAVPEAFFRVAFSVPVLFHTAPYERCQ